MRERGLPLSPMMARATLRATAPKTMTRRMMRPQPPTPEEVKKMAGIDYGWIEPSKPGRPWRVGGPVWAVRKLIGAEPEMRCPYGEPGDRLWGREAWRTLAQYDGLPPRDVPRSAPIWYEADGPAPPEFGRYRHGRFMMRWMSRILLVIESIGVERLQDISEEDAIAEGIERIGDRFKGYMPLHTGEKYNPALAKTSFSQLWESINGTGSWDANPWVWVVEFKRIGHDT